MTLMKSIRLLALAGIAGAAAAPMAVAQEEIKVSYQPALFWALPYYVADRRAGGPRSALRQA
ncbi:MAG: hypothetical protein HC844_12685, partial [Tabrizicola sp.]|nr:hypothetical protein [Tabrizicola sp.]